MSNVVVHHPRTTAEAIELLRAVDDARLLAGGASLVAMMNARLVEPKALISLRDVREMHGIAVQPDGALRIGAMTVHRVTASEEALTGTLAVVRAAAGSIANPPVRNMGTIGGSISLADPGADYPPALVAAGASVEVVGPKGTREVTASDFFLDWYTTVLAADELVCAVLLPAPRAGVGLYHKLARVAGDFATVSVALSIGAEGKVSIAVGGCGPVPIASAAANEALTAKPGDAAAIAEAGRMLADLADPIDDVRASADYRRMVIPRMVARAMATAAQELERTS